MNQEQFGPLDIALTKRRARIHTESIKKRKRKRTRRSIAGKIVLLQSVKGKLLLQFELRKIVPRVFAANLQLIFPYNQAVWEAAKL